MTQSNLPEEKHPPIENIESQPQPPQPIRIHHPQLQPYVTYSILGITVFVYLLQIGSGLLFGGDLVAFFGQKMNEAIVAGQLWRLITPILLHGNIPHIAFNMYALHVLGPTLERYFGHWQFLLLYLVSGFTGVVASFALTESPSLGASTSIFGLLGAQWVFAYQNQKVFGERARQAQQSIINIAVINFIIGLSPGIDNWGHFGGLVGGLMMSWVGGPVLTLTGDTPNFVLVNSRSKGQTLLAAILTTFLFGVITSAIVASYL